jgi:hypothetical protein
MTHQSRLSTDLSGLPPTESNLERFRPPITARLSYDSIAKVNVSITLHWVQQPEEDSVMKIDGEDAKLREKNVERARWKCDSHVES